MIFGGGGHWRDSHREMSKLMVMVMMLVAMMVMFIFYGGHGEILIERKRDVKIDGGGRRLERSIEEQSLQI